MVLDPNYNTLDINIYMSFTVLLSEKNIFIITWFYIIFKENFC
jgi:hypothetical protein